MIRPGTVPYGILFRMSNIRDFPVAPKRHDAEPDWRKLVDGFKLMLGALPPDQQQLAVDELTAMLRPIPAPRAGAVLGTLVRLLPRRAEWTVEEIKQEIASRGIEATPKEVYNSLGYLVRKGRVRRVGYGQYVVDGVGLTTTDDLGLEPPRYDDD
jgi:hypothetical protein